MLTLKNIAARCRIKLLGIRKWWMELFGVQFMNPNVPKSVRETCDRYGEQVIGTMLAGGFKPSTSDLQDICGSETKRMDARDWLTERAGVQEYRDRWIPLRDLILEIVVVVLIGWEIRLGYQQENKQATDFKDQQRVLTNLADNTQATAEILGSAAQNAAKAARLNERPWLNLSVGQGRLIDGQPLMMPIQLTNSGKTPAKNVTGVVVVNLLRKGQQPNFVYETGHPRYQIDPGIVPPNFPSNFLWAALPEQLPPSQKLQPVVVTSAIRQGIADEKLYIVVHAKISYSDLFGIAHWMTFCSYVENSALSGPDQLQCAHYNDADANY